MIYSNILNYCKENKIEVVFGSSEPLNEYMETLQEDVPFVNVSKEFRLSPKLTLENCNTIIIIGVTYDVLRRPNNIGILSQNSFVDYHNIVKEHLNNITNILEDSEALYFVDNGNLYERGFAFKYGLGFVGLNSFVINDNLGTYFNIGYILTTKKFETNEALNKKCFGCYKCIDVCPSGALKDGRCDIYKCSSYLTQKKELLTVDEIKSIGNFLYGCDLCQKVCPHNKQIKSKKSDFVYSALDFLNMDKKEFEKFKDTSFYWRGLSVIKRNAIYNIYNACIPNEEKINIINDRLKIEKMELPIRALNQVLDLLNEV
ncbi:MAG: epoxyqueuosine reductase [Lachnospirales bacterium]